MSTRIVGIRPPDEKWKKMKDIWDACEAADIEAPDEVSDFFNEEDPDPSGVKLRRDELGEAVVKYQGVYESGYEIHVDKLPKDVKIIRFTHSY